MHNSLIREYNDISNISHFEDENGRCFYNMAASYDAKLDMETGNYWTIIDNEYSSVDFPTVNELIRNGKLKTVIHIQDPKESNMFVIEDKAFTCESFDKYVKTQPYYGDFFVEIYLESDVPVEKKYTINFYGTTWVNAKNISFHDVQLALTYTKNALLYRKGDKMSYFSPMKDDYRKLVEIKHISFISYE